jgi:roadblock/LC7 domain-containing protein
MDWKSLGSALASIGLPLLGAALPVPGGAAFGAGLAALISSPSAAPADILATLQGNAAALEKAKEFEATNHQALMQMAYAYEIDQRKADAADLAAINATMQAEVAQSANEAWYQRAWRPFNGFVVGIASLVAVVFTCYLFYLAIVQKDTAALGIVPQLATSIAMILAVPGAAVGITAWTRGKAQVEQIRQQAT